MRNGEAVAATRETANETAVAIEFDGVPYAVMMATPADLEEFAIGFALSERIIGNVSEIARVDIRYGERGVGIDLRLEQERSARLGERTRALAGQSGCGICGIATIDEALPELPPLAKAPQLRASVVFEALDSLWARQTLNRVTGAVHAAAFCRTNGEIVVAREDVGRHNAFDKVIGHLAQKGGADDGFALLTSRCSYELVQKAILAAIPILATVSAPTELAVEIAKKSQLTLISLARSDSFLVFNDPFKSVVT
jgi:FdhD protein